MDRDKKITLSLFLSWVVFGLFNLFGQPQAFVPPIIVDGVLVTGLAVYFLFPFRRNGFYFSLIFLSVFMLWLALAETNWISLYSFQIYVPLISIIAFALIMIFTAGISKSLSAWERIVGFCIPIILMFSFLFAFFEINVSTEFIYGTYLAHGILSFIAVIFSYNQSESSILFRRILLVILLNFLFDTGNYLALLSLAS